MRATLGAGLLLFSTTLVGVAATPAEAASVCDDGSADTTWVDAAENGFALWAEPANWSNGVPTAESVVCIPDNVPGPKVKFGTTAAADVIDATGATVMVTGTLAVGTSFVVAELAGNGGELHGPGTATVTNSITGGVILRGSLVDLPQGTVVDAEVVLRDGSMLTVRGDTVLSDGALVDSFPGGLFTITETGQLTLDGADASATVEGGFANHGEVTLTETQQLLMLGASPEDAHPDQFSTGAFTGAPGARLWIAGTELRTGARLDHATFVDDITVPDGNVVTVAGSHLVDTFKSATPSILGAGELVVTERAVADARIGGSLTVTVPAGEVFTMGGDATVQDQAHLQVFGELAQTGDLFLGDETKLTLEGPGASLGGLMAALETGPKGTLDLRGGADLELPGRFRNGGLVQLSPGSRLIAGANFRQFSTGRLVTEVDATGLGRVRAAGRRDLAGELVVQRDPAYLPPVDTVLTLVTSNGRAEPDDAFDRVVSPKYGSRKLRVAYEVDRVRLRVEGLS